MIDPTLGESFRNQARSCREMGSTLYAELLERSEADLEAGGPVARLVEGWKGHPFLDNLALRWMGALHYLALGGDAPELAGFLPSTGGTFEADAAWVAVRTMAAERAGELRPLLDDCIQTNEVQRCCALLPGVLSFAAAHPQPLRLLEIGSSAGLNLCMDRYRIRLGDRTHGPESSPLSLETEWRGHPAPPAPGLEIAERAGCDIEPIDLEDPTRRRRLLSFVWPDQPARMKRLEHALQLVCPDPPPLARAHAEDWLEDKLATPIPGVATLIFHSVMWWYLPEDERAAVTRHITEAGARATTKAPLGWLRMEPPGPDCCELRLRSWPDESERLLAHAHFHGAWIDWQ